MEYKEIQDLLKLINKTDLTEVVIEKEDFKIKIRRKEPESNVIYTAPPQVPTLPPAQIVTPAEIAAPAPEPQAVAAKPAAAEAPAEKSDDANLYVFRSPMIGTFYRSSNPESPSFVNVGDQVQKGQVLCIIEAMKLFNEIESEIEGKIVKILVENAQPVEYDQELFLIDTGA